MVNCWKKDENVWYTWLHKHIKAYQRRSKSDIKFTDLMIYIQKSIIWYSQKKSERFAAANKAVLLLTVISWDLYQTKEIEKLTHRNWNMKYLGECFHPFGYTPSSHVTFPDFLCHTPFPSPSYLLFDLTSSKYWEGA